MRVVILGAGPAGLAAASVLVEGGARVTLLEARPRVGGLAGSERVGDHLADLGPHRLHTEANAEARRLLGGADGLTERPRRGAIHLSGRAVRYPLRPWALLRDAGPTQVARFALGALGARLRAPAGDDFAAETRRRVGDAIFRALYGPAARKVWGLAPEALHGDQARARVGASGPAALARRVFGRGGEPGCYLYPAAGSNQAAYDAWRDRLSGAGVDLRLGTRADAVCCALGRVLAVRAGDEAMPADRVISTLPLTALFEALQPTLGAPPALRTRVVVLLHLVIGRPRLSDRDVHYFPSEDVPFARIAEQRAFGGDADAPTDETVLTLDFYDWPGGPRVRATPEALLDAAWPTLVGLGLARAEVRRIAKTVAQDAYPVLDRGYRVARDEALDRLAGVDGLCSTGRGGLFLHVNQHHAIAMGAAAARATLRGDSGASWRAEARAFESFRIVD